MARDAAWLLVDRRSCMLLVSVADISLSRRLHASGSCAGSRFPSCATAKLAANLVLLRSPCGLLSLCSRVCQRLESSSGDSCSRARIDSTTSTPLNPKCLRSHHATAGHFDLVLGYSHGLCGIALRPQCRRDACAR